MKRSPAKPVLHATLRKFLHPSCERLEQIVSPNDLGLFRAVHPLAGLIDPVVAEIQLLQNEPASRIDGAALAKLVRRRSTPLTRSIVPRRPPSVPTRWARCRRRR
jgi:hypothetical protein